MQEAAVVLGVLRERGRKGRVSVLNRGAADPAPALGLS